MRVSSRFTTRSALVNVITVAIEKASKSLIRDFGELEHLQVSRKGLGDFVSAADRRSESILIAELQKARPAFGFLTEESGIIEGKDTNQRWIIDPLDGTTNFLHGIPHFAITVALQMGNQIVAGVTYDPIKDEMFWAEKGKGAFLNQRRIRVSARRQLEDAVIGFGVPYDDQQRDRHQKRMNALDSKVAALRHMGAYSLDLAYVACGRFDAFFADSMNLWDYAAGLLFAQEAGGMVTTLQGDQDVIEKGSILAANHDIHKGLLTPFSKI